MTFQHFVNEIFTDMLDIPVLVYLENILIYSDNMEDHQKHVKEVLQWLQVHRLYACEDKCKFHKTKLEFLDLALLKMTSDKVKVILEWPEPHKVQDIQSFLGLWNF